MTTYYCRTDMAAVWWESLTDFERQTAVDDARDQLGREPSIPELWTLFNQGRVLTAGRG